MVKRNAPGSKLMLESSETPDVETLVDQHFFALEPIDVSLTPDLDYRDLVDRISPFQCARSRQARDKDEPLFRVAAIPIGTNGSITRKSGPLGKTISSSGFALMVTMNHTLGDGHTYYRLYGM